MKCYQIRISGEIQGQGMRFCVMHMANQHQVKGFVKYLNPSEMLIEAEGKVEQLAPFINYCSTDVLPSKSCIVEIMETEVKGYQSFEMFATMVQSNGLPFKSTVPLPLLSFLKKYFSGPQTELILIGLFTFFQT